MTLYAVHVSQDWVYRIEADSPEDAAQTVDDGEAPNGECTGYSIDTVTTPDDIFGDVELRSPVPCRGGCGKQLPASSSGECRECLLRRCESLDRR